MGEWLQMRRTSPFIRGGSLLVGRRKLLKRFVKGEGRGGFYEKKKKRKGKKKRDQSKSNRPP